MQGTYHSVGRSDKSLFRDPGSELRLEGTIRKTRENNKRDAKTKTGTTSLTEYIYPEKEVPLPFRLLSGHA